MKPFDGRAKRLSSGLVTLAIISPGLLAFSGCGRSNCDNNFSTPQTSDDCGRGGRNGRTGSGAFVGGGGGTNGGTTSASGSQRGGFGGFGRMFGAGS